MRVYIRKIERRQGGGAKAGEVVHMKQVQEIRSLCFFFLTIFCILISDRILYLNRNWLHKCGFYSVSMHTD